MNLELRNYRPICVIPSITGIFSNIQKILPPREASYLCMAAHLLTSMEGFQLNPTRHIQEQLSIEICPWAPRGRMEYTSI